MPFGFLAPEYFKIIWLSNILALSVHDEGHSVHDEGHSVHDEGHSVHDEGHSLHDEGHSVHDEGHSVHDEGHSVHDEGHSRNASCGLNYKNIFSLNLRFYFYELHCHG